MQSAFGMVRFLVGKKLPPRNDKAEDHLGTRANGKSESFTEADRRVLVE